MGPTTSQFLSRGPRSSCDGRAYHSSSSSTTTTARPPAPPQAAEGEKKARLQKEQASNCPRCNSTNTKFCYYNNYSLSQPRYFCKTCRRYWTEGGSLRNVPVGGGSRKNKRPSSLSSSTSSTATSAATSIIPPNPKKLLLPGVGGDFIPASGVAPISFSTATTTHKLTQDGVQDLHLGLPHLVLTPLPDFGATSSSATGLLRPFLPLSTLSELYSSSGFGLMQDLIRAPPLSFPVDAGAGGGIGGVSGGFEAVGMSNSEKTGRLLFPFEDIKPLVVHDPTNTSAAAAAPAPAGGGNGSGSASASEFEMSGRSSQAAGDPPGFWSDIIGDSSGTGEG
ncbi:hypothetical protein ZIOFF_022374 [Zingiber officinale]|uniref:Dof zinc finger protein n=1 Tax=Zingiber officinale TaxID=94328 RepID=A0A8J5H2T0_ZINOF|nr:hypothetical protein ZIOFF_022374 [Zingiber officinale]